MIAPPCDACEEFILPQISQIHADGMGIIELTFQDPKVLHHEGTNDTKGLLVASSLGACG
jgi:hypothetical protein